MSAFISPALSITSFHIRTFLPPTQDSGLGTQDSRTQEEVMAANSRQGGIQQLLAAEQEAQGIIDAARNGKLGRLKQAKEQADLEVAAYRAQVELNLQRRLAESSGDSGANVKRLEQETEAKISHLKNEAAKVSKDVASMLLKHVTTVRI